jgi:hypothetical protein
VTPEEAISSEIKDYAEKRLGNGDPIENILADIFSLAQDVLEGILANRVMAGEEEGDA